MSLEYSIQALCERINERLDRIEKKLGTLQENQCLHDWQNPCDISSPAVCLKCGEECY